jgi:c-di-GMP-binding flagellar brake protein YcgR
MDTQPAPLDASAAHTSSHSVSLGDYRISSEVELKSLLKQLVETNTMVTLSGPGGASYTTLLWAADASRGVISFSAEAHDQRLQQLMDGGELTAVAYMDSIKVQFDVDGVVLVRGNHTAINARYPKQFYRFQRRSYFRVKPLSGNLPCAQFRHPAIPEMSLSLRMLDISLGGVALFLPDNVPMLAAGSTLRHCQLMLDDETRLDVDLVLHHVSVMNPDAKGARLGCEILNLHGHDERALQGYINQTQKRRLALGR